MSKEKLWFSFDGEELDFHETEKEARDRIELAFDQDRDLASSDGWPEWMESMCYGKVTHAVFETSREPWPVEVEDKDDPNYHPPFDDIVDYTLKPVEENPDEQA